LEVRTFLEHHLFPSICHINHPGISKAIEETCRQFGVKCAERRTFWIGLAEHYRWLRKMGKYEERVEGQKAF
jgi:linoleoyl-CoA desaturase